MTRLRLALGLLRGDPASWMAWHVIVIAWHKRRANAAFEVFMRCKREMEGK